MRTDRWTPEDDLKLKRLAVASPEIVDGAMARHHI